MKHVIVIGGGVAGMQCSAELATQNIKVTLLEKESDTGGKVRGWHKLFPTFTPANEVLSGLRHKIALTQNITIKTGCEATTITPHEVTLSTGESIACDAVVVATGYTLFDARIKEEYGYGIYDNVITSADLEDMFSTPEGKQSFWDIAPMNIYNSHYHIEIFECTFEDITEIDTYHELSLIDPDYAITPQGIVR